MNFEKRTKRFVANLSRRKDAKNDAAVITALPNLTYFFNYSGISFERFCCGLVSIDEKKTALVIPKLDESKSEKSIADSIFVWTDSEGYENALLKALEFVGTKGNFLGCEDSITLRLIDSIKKVRPRAKFESVSDSISGQRLIKDEDEIVAVRNSTKKLAIAYQQLPELLKAGKKETDVGFEVRKILTEEGTSVEFCAVQSGSNGAVPHLETSRKKIDTGDLVVVDISSVDESGYYADFTRTFSIGNPTSEQTNVYETVRKAQDAGLTATRPGILAKEVDRAAREIIEKSGYGKNFIHRTGHGLGLEVHEGPWISEGNSQRLRQGMVFTIEPGVYLPGKFGVRIEDNIVVTNDGIENLTNLEHELIRV